MKKRETLSPPPAFALRLSQPPTTLPADGGFAIDAGGVLTGYYGSGGDVAIPDGVTAIGDGAFYDRHSLTGVTIPDSVTAIGEWAFADCVKLTGVTIPASVAAIGGSAFQGCDSLAAIEAAGENPKYRSVGGILFTKDMTALVQCPGGIQGSVAVPDGVAAIAAGAFAGCLDLTGVTIPASVTTIGEGAFERCVSLTAIEVAGENPAYRSVGGMLFTKDMTALVQCPGGIQGDVAVPDGVTAIGDGAFADCVSLTGVTMPDSVTAIGGSAFQGCDSLTAIEVAGENPKYRSVGGMLFTKDMTALVQCPGGIQGDVTVPDGVTAIGDGAFADCVSLTGVTIPDSVTTIGEGAFDGCLDLTIRGGGQSEERRRSLRICRRRPGV